MTFHVTPPPPARGSEVDRAERTDGEPLEGPGATGSARGGTRPRRAAWVGLGAVVVAAVAVFWAFEALPFQDLPAHAGLIAMRHRFESSPFEQRFYVLAPHIGPYSLFRFLGEMFVRVGGPLFAVRALATLPVVATPLAMLFARRRLFGERSPVYGFLGVTLSFGIMTLLGFASYLLGVAVMLVALTLWLELLVAADDVSGGVAAPLWRRELVMSVVALLLFVAHGHAFVIFLYCAGIAAIATGHREARLLRIRSLVPALLLAGWVAWIERGATIPPGSVARAQEIVPRFEGLTDKLGLLVTATLMTRTGIDFAVGVLLLAFTSASAIMVGRTLGARAGRGAEAPVEVRHCRALYASAAATFVAFLALPHSVGWFGFVDGRLVPVALMLALLGIRRSALPRSLALALRFGPPLFAATLSALALVASYRFQSEARGYEEVLARVPAGTRLLNLPLDPNSDAFTAHPFIHYDKLALAERPLVVSDIWFHQGSALYPTPENPVLRLPSTYRESDLKSIDWPLYRLDDWDYVLVRTRPHAAAPHAPAELALEAHRGGWWLYRRRSAGAPVLP